MTFEEYIEQTIATLLVDIKDTQACIANLESAREFYREFLKDCGPQSTETRKEPISAQVVAGIEPIPDDPPPPRGKGDRRRKEFWTPERKAEASRLAKENWANRQKRPPVEERPTANFKKEVTPALKPVTREWPDHPVATIEVKPDVLEMLKGAEPMRQLVCTGKTYELRGDDEPEPTPVIGDQPVEPQKIRLIKREHLSIVRPIKAAGNGYKPGALLDLGHDQCRYTIEGKTMCGAETVKDKSWCPEHYHVIRHGSKALEAAE